MATVTPMDSVKLANSTQMNEDAIVKNKSTERKMYIKRRFAKMDKEANENEKKHRLNEGKPILKMLPFLTLVLLTPSYATAKEPLRESDDNDYIQIPALGRSFHLGDLYDLKKDAVIPGPKLWNTTSYDESNVFDTKSEVVLSESIDEKHSHFDIEAHVALSFMAGLISVEGSAKYLDDRKETNNVARVSLRIKSRTFERTLKAALFRKIDYPSTLEKITSATHVVSRIQYGAGAVFTFESKISKNQKERDVAGSLSIAVKSIPSMSISGSGSLNLDEAKRKNYEKITVRFNGDYLLKTHPTSYADAIEVYKTLPSLLGENNENSVPIQVWLYPLEKLGLEPTSQIIHQIKDDLVSLVTAEMESIQQIEIEANTIIQSEEASYHPRIVNKVDTFLSHVRQFKLLFQQSLAALLPEIRGGSQAEKSLSDLLARKENSLFSRNSLKKWLDHYKEELDVLTTTHDLPNYCKDDGEFAKYLTGDVDNNVPYTFALILHLDTIKEEHLEVMNRYLDYMRQNISKDLKTPAKDKWWSSENENDMLHNLTVKSRALNEFFEIDKKMREKTSIKSNVKFAVKESVLNLASRNEQRITIELYKDAKRIDSNFEIPTSPLGKPEEKSSSYDAIRIRWNEPEQGKENVASYKVDVFTLNDTTDNPTFVKIQEKSTEGKIEYCEITGLDSQRPFIIKVGVYTRFGKCAESIASEVIYTRPCPPGMFHVTDHRCESCPKGTFSEEEKSQYCSPCPMGTFYNGFGATSELNCTQCPKGTYNDKNGSVSIDQCTKCPKGRYNGKIGSLAVSDCLKCPPGTFNNIEGQISNASCTKCQAGSYNPNDGASVCIPCISGITTTQQGAASYDECGKGSGKGSLDSKLNSTVREIKMNVDINIEVTRKGLKHSLNIWGGLETTLDAMKTSLEATDRTLEAKIRQGQVRCQSNGGIVAAKNVTKTDDLTARTKAAQVDFSPAFSAKPALIVAFDKIYTGIEIWLYNVTNTSFQVGKIGKSGGNEFTWMACGHIKDFSNCRPNRDFFLE